MDGKPNRGKESCFFKFLRHSVDRPLVSVASHVYLNVRWTWIFRDIALMTNIKLFVNHL